MQTKHLVWRKDCMNNTRERYKAEHNQACDDVEYIRNEIEFREQKLGEVN